MSGPNQTYKSGPNQVYKRRGNDNGKSIQKKDYIIHPALAPIVSTVILILLAVIGYLLKSKIEDFTYELREVKKAVSKQMEITSANNEWRDGMNQWKSTTELRLTNLEHHVDRITELRHPQYDRSGNKLQGVPGAPSNSIVAIGGEK